MATLTALQSDTPMSCTVPASLISRICFVENAVVIEDTIQNLQLGNIHGSLTSLPRRRWKTFGSPHLQGVVPSPTPRNLHPRSSSSSSSDDQSDANSSEKEFTFTLAPLYSVVLSF